MGWTDPTGHVWGSGEALASANLNLYVEQNLAYLGGGFGATIYQTVNQSIPNNVATPVTLQSAETDPNGMATTGAAARITIPAGAGGLYLMMTNVHFQSPAAAAIQAFASLYRNGAEMRRGPTRGLNATDNLPALPAMAIRQLAAGDYIQTYVFQNTGFALSTASGEPFVWLSIYLLGPK